MNDLKVCEVCGFLLDDDEDFCPMCGWIAKYPKFKLISRYIISK